MEYTTLEWEVNENGKKQIKAGDIDSFIDIDEDNKQVKNAKAFFRAVIYQSFLNNWSKKIILKENEEIEIKEVNIVINELIALCNDKLEEIQGEN